LPITRLSSGHNEVPNTWQQGDDRAYIGRTPSYMREQFAKVRNMPAQAAVGVIAIAKEVRSDHGRSGRRGSRFWRRVACEAQEGAILPPWEAALTSEAYMLWTLANDADTEAAIRAAT
jgi:hypothetical protein